MSQIAELVPSLREIGVLWDYVAPLFLPKEVEQGMGELARAAQSLNVRSRNLEIHTQADFDSALAVLPSAPIQAIFAMSGPCDIAGSTFRSVGLLAYSVNWSEAAARCARSSTASCAERIRPSCRSSSRRISSSSSMQGKRKPSGWRFRRRCSFAPTG